MLPGHGGYKAAQVAGSDCLLFLQPPAHPLVEVLISRDTAQDGSQVLAAWGLLLAP